MKKQDQEKEIRETVRRMPLEERIALCSGADNWTTKAYPEYGIPSVRMSDGPHGLRRQPDGAAMLEMEKSLPAACFPAESILACSWDEELVRETAGAIAEEAGAAGVSLLLGPGVNVKRNPLCGRNFEYFSEDPFLSGRLGAAYVCGLQEKGIGACAKHFACNSQEYCRMASDSVLDERTLRELYLSAFEYIVKTAPPAAVMCSYNKINGVYSSENGRLLTDILRGEWGYKGIVVTDWGAVGERAESFRSGCDLAMPGGSAYREKEAAEEVRSGALPEEDVNRSAERAARFAREREEGLRRDFTFSAEEHHHLAYRAAVQSAVLLKNEGGALPLRKKDRISAAGRASKGNAVPPDKKEEVCFIGRMAEVPRYQGSGSSHIRPERLHTIRELAPGIPYAPGYEERGQTSEALLGEAAGLARSAGKTVVFAGLTEADESEGLDREDMRMPEGHLALIEVLAGAAEQLIVVLFGGSPMEAPWADRADAVLYMGLSGQAQAEAVLALLYGEETPSGKLAESWPFCYEDCPSSGFYSHGMRNAEYREGIFAGYRYYDTAHVPVRWPFGWGLSYTSFALSDLRREGNRISVRVENTGGRAGAEVVQLYIGKEVSAVFRPRRELKGFQKVFLQAGEEREVFFDLCPEDFRVWADGWMIEKGEYQIYAGDHLGEDMLSAACLAEELFPETAMRVDSGNDREEEIFPKEIIRTDWSGGRAEDHAQDGMDTDDADGDSGKEERLTDAETGGASARNAGTGERTEGPGAAGTAAVPSGVQAGPEKTEWRDRPVLREIPSGSRYAAGENWYSTLKGKPSRADLEGLMGRKIHDPGKEEVITVTSTLGDVMQASALLRLVYCLLDRIAAKKSGGRETVQYRMTMAMISGVTLRAAQTAGGIRRNIADGLALIANGHPLRGIFKMLRKS